MSIGRKSLLGCLFVAIGLLVLGFLRPLVPPMVGAHPDLHGGEVESIQIQIYPWHSRAASEQASLQEYIIPSGKACEALLAVLKNAHKGDDHRCGEIGEIVIKYQGGNTDTLGLLQGHGPAACEFRHARSLYRMSRIRFHQAMEAGGVDTSLFVNRERD